jgi:hypothetical protein
MCQAVQGESCYFLTVEDGTDGISRNFGATYTSTVCIIPVERKSNFVLLLLDNISVRTVIEAINLSLEHCSYLVKTTVHTSHKFHPLDGSF